MADAIVIRLGGYSPPGSTHSNALDRIAASLRTELGTQVEVEVEYNYLDRGSQIQELLAAVESGEVSLCYFSTSYLVERVPELGVIDLPFVFDSLAHAHRCLDGELGRLLSARTRAATGLVPIGYWDNGLRHLSNRLRHVRSPADCAGLRIRLQPNWAHERFFEELGAVPVLTDLRDGIEMIEQGAVDAQENPLANFVAYGIERVHPYLTLTAHAYGGRGVYASALQLDRWPERTRHALEVSVAHAVAEQRREAAAKERELRASLARSGTEIVVPTPVQLDQFRLAAAPVLSEARSLLDPRVFELLEA